MKPTDLIDNYNNSIEMDRDYRLIRKPVVLRSSKDINAVLISDLHVQNPHAWLPGIMAACKYALYSKSYVIILGDIFEIATKKRPASQMRPISIAKDFIYESLMPLVKENLLLEVIYGNHTRNSDTHNEGWDAELDLIKEFNRTMQYINKDIISVKDPSDIGITEFISGANSYKAVYAHGAGGGGTHQYYFNMMNRLETMAQGVDWIAIGHSHLCGNITEERHTSSGARYTLTKIIAPSLLSNVGENLFSQKNLHTFKPLGVVEVNMSSYSKHTKVSSVNLTPWLPNDSEFSMNTNKDINFKKFFARKV
jgi:hypothetical protein